MNIEKKMNNDAGGSLDIKGFMDEFGPIEGESNDTDGAVGCLKKGNTKPSSKRVNPSKNWVFTLNNFNEKDISNILLNKWCRGATKYMFQEEIGESGTPHLQGFICFRTKVRPLSIKLSKRIHWEKMKGTVLDNIKYCSKSETKNGDCYYKGCKPFKEVTAILKEDFYEWEVSLLDIIQKCDSDRIIHWVYEKTGGVGKSCFCKWLGIHEQAVICSGKASDMKYMITQRYAQGDSTDLILFDVPRRRLNHVSYEGIEEIKNGFFCSSKYETTMTIMNSPTIVIFANEEPDYQSVSLDRWRVYQIINQKLVIQPLPLNIVGLPDNSVLPDGDHASGGLAGRINVLPDSIQMVADAPSEPHGILIGDC